MSGDGVALVVRGLSIHFRDGRRPSPVVDNLALELPAGEITGLAGESGSGKTLAALALLGLNDRRVFTTTLDECLLDGQALSAAGLVAQRGRGIAMVFQDPATALDPVFSIGSQLTRSLRRNGGLSRAEARQRALEALAAIGFDAPAELMRRYPHELSGGMRQLCVLAMAQALRPAVLLADEPTTALDAVSQLHVLERLRSLASEHGTAVLLISHDLRLLAHYARRVYVMYRGRLVERTTGAQLVADHHHPYTRGLVDALPRLASTGQAPARGIPGNAPTAGEPVSGCVFAPRCAWATAQCETSAPESQSTPQGEVACHHPLGTNS
jgi:oligopeptide/dipeptide ABC transporter ATP-binding protein